MGLKDFVTLLFSQTEGFVVVYHLVVGILPDLARCARSGLPDLARSGSIRILVEFARKKR